MRIPLLALTLAMLAIAPGCTDASPLARRCHGSITDAKGAAAGVEVLGRGTTCATAKRVLRRYLHSKPPCAGPACLRVISRWTCLAASAAAHPRLASCNRGKRMIVAHAISA